MQDILETGLLTPLIFYLVSFIILIAGIVIWVKDKKLRKICTEMVWAEVTNVEVKTHSDSDGTHHSYIATYKYSYVDETGRMADKVITDKEYGGYCPFAVRETVELFYNPDNPDMFYIAGDKSTSVIVKILIIFALIFMAATTVICYFAGNFSELMELEF